MSGLDFDGACLEIEKYLRRVGADRTILYRNLDRTYTMMADGRTRPCHADERVLREGGLDAVGSGPAHLVVVLIRRHPEVCVRGRRLTTWV